MVREAEVCCTKRVSRPAATLALASHAAIWPVMSYRPLPRVATFRRWEVICMAQLGRTASAAKFRAGIERAHGERENGLEEGTEHLPRQQQADDTEGAQRAAEMLDAARHIFGDQQAENAVAIQRRSRDQIELAQQQVEREQQAHESRRTRCDARRRRFYHVHEADRFR